MADQGEQYDNSWILHHLLNSFVGGQETVTCRRRMTILRELMVNFCNAPTKLFFRGCVSEGSDLVASDTDTMLIDTSVLVTCPFQDPSIPPDCTDKTVCVMRNINSRPGYVTLELRNLGQSNNENIRSSIVRVGDVLNISGEYKRSLSVRLGTTEKSVHSFPYAKWPREATEWVSRPRLHGWPDKALRDEIIQGGCHLVHTGDTSAPNTIFEWQISFSIAERKLIHSLTHTQFLVYMLLRYFFKQISDRLKQVFGEDDVLSPYIIKTILFHSVENTPGSLWQEKNTFFCFLLCLKMLIGWIEAEHCPNYFINSNNMFRGKVYGENKQKLLCFLTDLHDMKWLCLSVGTAIRPTLGERIHRVRNGACTDILLSRTNSERTRDIRVFIEALAIAFVCEPKVALTLLSMSKEDIDGFVAYITTAHVQSCTGIYTFEMHFAAKGNKEKYKHLRKCRNLMTPYAKVCASPGMMTLATYCYQTGKYTNALEMCGQMISSFKIFVSELRYLKAEQLSRYEHIYCGRGYSLLHKCQEVCVGFVEFPRNGLQFCPSQLLPEMINIELGDSLLIPPLPYAVFLKFLCYHELGDTRRRDEALIHLRAVKYEEKHGGSQHWIVHNLLGICYEMVGDPRRALREYMNSVQIKSVDQHKNPATKRIEHLQHLQ